MRMKLICLAASLLLPLVAHADTLGPITVGSNAPFGNGEVIVNNNGTFTNFYDLMGFSDQNLGYFSETIAFTFDIAPGWTIDSLQVDAPWDWGSSYQNYAFEFSEVLTLCSADGVCSTGLSGGHGGNLPFPPLPSNAQVGPGTGVFQINAYAYDAGVITKPGESNLKINYSQMSPVPEPSSLALFATGGLGLFTAARRKLKM